MTRSELLPSEVVDWLRNTPRGEMRRLLSNSMAECAQIAGAFPNGGESADVIEALDARYFDAHDAGREKEAMRYFKRARLLSAHRFLLAGEDNEALFEFFHSLDDATPSGLFAVLTKGQ